MLIFLQNIKLVRILVYKNFSIIYFTEIPGNHQKEDGSNQRETPEIATFAVRTDEEGEDDHRHQGERVGAEQGGGEHQEPGRSEDEGAGAGEDEAEGEGFDWVVK